MKRLSPLLFYLLLIYACSYKSNDKLEQKNPHYDKAIEYRELEKIDSSYAYFIKAKDLYVLQKDSLGVGKCLVNMGYIAKNSGDYFAAQEISLSAIPYLDETKKDHASYISSNYNTLGLAFYQLREYSDAIRFYNKALKFIDVPLHKFICLNNIAKVQEEIHNYDKAIKNYHLVLAGTIDEPIEYARALANLSFAKWLHDSRYKALPGLLKSLAIREAQNDSLGLNHSYAQLSDYYIKTDPYASLDYANKMYYIANKLNRPEDKLEALDKLIKLNPEIKSKSYFKEYRSLQDSIQTIRNRSKNQFALIRYETEKHKTDNLLLQKDNTEKKYQLIKQRSILICGLLFAFFVFVVSVVLYKKRKQKLALETASTIRENELKTSKKVHDVVANGLYTIMTKLDNREAFKDDPIVDEMEELYEKSRNISYEKNVPIEPRFNEKLSELLKSFESNKIEVLISGNHEKMWIGLSNKITFELEHTLQELMVNMKKHSQASKVIIKFEKLNNQIHISYTDNGKGIKDFSPGNGLRNTEIRIKSIAGLITFDTKPNEGLKVNISFPI